MSGAGKWERTDEGQGVVVVDRRKKSRNKDEQGTEVTDGKGGSSCVCRRHWRACAACRCREVVLATVVPEVCLLMVAWPAVETGDWLADRDGQYSRSKMRRSSHSWESWMGLVGGWS